MRGRALSAGLFPDLSVPVPSQPGEGPAGSLWRNQLNVIRLGFGCDLPGVPTPGQVTISEITDGGGGACAYGPDLSGSFTFSIENTGAGFPRILKMQSTGGVLTHRKWYAVRNTGGWSGVANFEAQYVVQVGDANNDLRVLFNDLGVINGSIPCFADCDERLDIDGDGRILFNDLGVANGSVPSFPVDKPCGN